MDIETRRRTTLERVVYESVVTFSAVRFSPSSSPRVDDASRESNGTDIHFLSLPQGRVSFSTMPTLYAPAHLRPLYTLASKPSVPPLAIVSAP